MKRKDFVKPVASVMELQCGLPLLMASSPEVQGGGTLDGGWGDSGNDAWDGSSSPGSGSGFGGWTDNGGSAWE